MGRTRKMLNHMTVFATVATTSLIIANIASDSLGIMKANRKINKLEEKLDKAHES